MNRFPPDPDTRLGGAQRAFPSTCWSRIADGPEDPEARHAALLALAESYWKPVYAYIRARWAKANEEAKDLTQEFFLWMMEGDFLARADPGRGRFRAFLKVALKHFLSSEETKQGRLKRGGGRTVIRFDAASDEDDPIDPPDAAARTPEEALDDSWRRELLTRAEDRLEEDLRREGKGATFAIFRDYYLAPAGEPDYREIAARHQVDPSDVHNRLKVARRRFRQILSNLIAETVRDEEELRMEVRALFGDDPA